MVMYRPIGLRAVLFFKLQSRR